MKKSLFIIFQILLILGLNACKRAPKEEVTPKDLYYDIERMQIDMRTSVFKDLYDPKPFDQLKEEVMEGKINRLECIFRLRDILKEFKCVHLSLIPVEYNDLYGKIIPFHFYCFGKDYHVYYTLPKYQKYLGWRLVEIGGVDIEKVCKILSENSVHPYETDMGAKYCIEANGISYFDLETAGLVQKKNRVNLTLENHEGKRVNVLCKPFTPTSNTLWYHVVPEKWNEFLHHNDKRTPFRIEADPDKKTVYMQYNSCMDNVDYSLKNWISDMLNELKSGKYDTVVFDLRYNPGGAVATQTDLNYLLYKNKEELDKYNLAIVATGRTYSCACDFINDFIRNYPQVKLFGEETGQAVFNYTWVSPNNLLKKLNCYFTYPTILDDVPELYKRAQEVTHTDIHCGTFPDVTAYESYEEWLHGEDGIYNAIYDYYSGLPRRPVDSSQ